MLDGHWGPIPPPSAISVTYLIHESCQARIRRDPEQADWDAPEADYSETEGSEGEAETGAVSAS